MVSFNIWPKLKLTSLILFIIPLFYSKCVANPVYDIESNEYNQKLDHKYKEISKINEFLAFIDFFKRTKMNLQKFINSKVQFLVEKEPRSTEQEISKKSRDDFYK